MSATAALFVLAVLASPAQHEPAINPAHLRISSPPEQSALYKTMGFALVGTGATDVLATELALANGAHERNPFGQTNVGGRIALKSATTAIVWWATDEVHKRGKPKLALWIRIAVVAGWGYATVHNLRVAQ